MFRRIFAQPANASPPFRWRMWSAVMLAAFALLLYDIANAIAGWRGIDRCLAFAWEFELPRINWFVVPYLSIDILLVISPLCARRYDEWRTLLLRLFWVFVISCAVFVVVPYRCGYHRDLPEDWTAPFYQLLYLTDLPYNQAPSLHISEAIISAPVVLARIRHPLLRAGLIAWYVLGSLGTVFAYQHHVIDLITGAVLGVALIKFIPRR